ncbi:hypothetical protein EYF80_049514 [Liparis tanakae]|uniref:Uncharacterized protein n=1 Tax=Liparis tanakae TaxID=230148 RepID=A0A4Z2FGL5_9TELE|nr:hypothetical protein EYF80_049514 [Liparis tanakae]
MKIYHFLVLHFLVHHFLVSCVKVSTSLTSSPAVVTGLNIGGHISVALEKKKTNNNNNNAAPQPAALSLSPSAQNPKSPPPPSHPHARGPNAGVKEAKKSPVSVSVINTTFGRPELAAGRESSVSERRGERRGVRRRGRVHAVAPDEGEHQTF